MKSNFFEYNENFDTIIGHALAGEIVEDIRPITIGWTNLVFEATAANNSYFFRFPRNEFWAKMIVKDCAFCQFIYGKTTLATPNLLLCFDKHRPFSMHQKIEGYSLADRADRLTQEEMEDIAADISHFIVEISHLQAEDLPKHSRISLFDFLNELATRHFPDLSLWHHDFFQKHDSSKHLVHGDLNPSNILINEDNKAVAVIDFCFAGVGNPYADLSRVIGRSSETFGDIMRKQYERVSGERLDLPLLEGFVDGWTNIDQGYISYIRMHHSEIELPNMPETKPVHTARA